VAPDEGVRRRVEEAVGRDRFLLVHLTAPLEICRERDPEGRYELADRGELANFPGVSAPYEAPTEPDLALPTHEIEVADCVEQLVELLRHRDILH
jgi:bifunctional enzyme CysN/CysC